MLDLHGYLASVEVELWSSIKLHMLLGNCPLMVKLDLFCAKLD